MSKEAAIEFQRLALLGLLSGLFAMAGLVQGGTLIRVPRALQLKVLRVLRPAESALRRLIFAVSRRMPEPSPRTRSAPSGTIPKGEGSANRIPAFALFDPRKSYPELSQGKRPRPGAGPRMFFFDGYDAPPEPEPETPERDPDDAAQLFRRMQAMQRALENISREARRLRRAMAKRASAPPGPKRYGPLRRGMPPGYRVGGNEPVDEILYQCALMAEQSIEPPNTS